MENDVNNKKVDRSDYYREYMRKRREAEKEAKSAVENVNKFGSVNNPQWDKK